MNSSVGYFLSADSLIDAGDKMIAAVSMHIREKGTSWGSTDLTVPSNTPVGNYYLIVRIDNDGIITETNENNNTRALAITVAYPSSDLGLTSFISLMKSQKTAPGNEHTTIAQLQSGNTAVQQVSIKYYLSKDSVVSSEDSLIETQNIGTIGRMATFAERIFLKIPAKIAPGAYYLIAEANSPSDANISNNKKAISIEVQTPTVDFSISDISIFGAVSSPGAKIYPVVTVKNSGTANASSRLHYYLSNDDVFDAGDVLLGFDPLAVNGEDLAIYQPVIQLGASVGNGTYYIIAYADQVKWMPETNENNNWSATKLILQDADADLTVTFSDTTTLSFKPVKELSFSAYEFNKGKTFAENHWYYFYLSTDTVYNTGDIGFDGRSTPGLPGGGKDTISAKYYFHQHVKPGTYYILVTTDIQPSASISETNESNNVAWRRVVVLPLDIDFTLSVSYNDVLPLISDATNGSAFSPNVTVHNSGSDKGYDQTVSFYFSADSVLDIGDNYVGYKYVESVPALGSVVLNNVSLTMPRQAASGTYYIIGVADDHNNKDLRLTETNEKNNTAKFKVSVSGQPFDLIPEIISTNKTTVSSGEELIVLVHEFNKGNAFSYNHTIEFYISKDTLLDDQDVFVHERFASAIEPERYWSVTDTLTVPAVASGNYYLLAYSDYFTNIQETTRDNNVAHAAIKINGSVVTGVDDRNEKASVNLYPNPSTGVFYISEANNYDETEVTDLAGTIITVKKLKGLSDNQLDLGFLQAGTYLVKMKKEGITTVVERIILTR